LLDNQGFFGLDDPLWFPQRLHSDHLWLAWVPKPLKDPYKNMEHLSWLIPSFYPISTDLDFEPSRLNPHIVQITAHRHAEMHRAHVGLTSWLRAEEGAINIANTYLADAS
jgi:hypothetical protein